MVKLSIITINYNNCKGLQKSIESVLAQRFTDYEYIIVDGGSVDGSKEYIEEQGDKLAWWISEKDNGVYNAMNKGVVRSKGEYLLFLNSGDYLCDEFVLSKLFSRPILHDIIYGNILWDVKGNLNEGKFPDLLTFEFFTKHSLPHQSSLIKKVLFSNIGLYDENYSIISDWVFFILAIYKYNCSYIHVELPISVCNRDGISCDPANWNTIVSDRAKVIQTHFSSFACEYETIFSIRKELIEIKSSLWYRINNKLKTIFRIG
jgi:glycosyltransferase involved in cell wall biosynthesis